MSVCSVGVRHRATWANLRILLGSIHSAKQIRCGIWWCSCNHSGQLGPFNETPVFSLNFHWLHFKSRITAMYSVLGSSRMVFYKFFEKCIQWVLIILISPPMTPATSTSPLPFPTNFVSFFPPIEAKLCCLNIIRCVVWPSTGMWLTCRGQYSLRKLVLPRLRGEQRNHRGDLPQKRRCKMGEVKQ